MLCVVIDILWSGNCKNIWKLSPSNLEPLTCRSGRSHLTESPPEKIRQLSLVFHILELNVLIKSQTLLYIEFPSLTILYTWDTYFIPLASNNPQTFWRKLINKSSRSSYTIKTSFVRQPEILPPVLWIQTAFFFSATVQEYLATIRNTRKNKLTNVMCVWARARVCVCH